MRKKKKSKTQRKTSTRLGIVIGVASLIFSAIAAIPVIEDKLFFPKLSVIRQSVHVLDDRIIADYLVSNSGHATANDIFLEIETREGDQIFLPFSPKHEIEKKGKDWIVNIESMKPGETANVTLFSDKVQEFKQAIQVLGTLPDPLNIWIDYREGERSDVVFDDSQELKDYIKENYSKK